MMSLAVAQILFDSTYFHKTDEMRFREGRLWQQRLDASVGCSSFCSRFYLCMRILQKALWHNVEICWGYFACGQGHLHILGFILSCIRYMSLKRMVSTFRALVLMSLCSMAQQPPWSDAQIWKQGITEPLRLILDSANGTRHMKTRPQVFFHFIAAMTMMIIISSDDTCYHSHTGDAESLEGHVGKVNVLIMVFFLRPACNHLTTYLVFSIFECWKSSNRWCFVTF